MMKIAVVYKSKYGATKQYAEWIAKELDCSIFEYSDIKPEKRDYDLIIYGGSLFAGMISGVGLAKKCKNAIVFTVGLTDPNQKYLDEVIKNNSLGALQFFYFRGALDDSILSFPHKLGMKILRGMLGKKKEKTENEKVLLDSAGKPVSFMNKDSIKPLIDYVKSL